MLLCYAILGTTSRKTLRYKLKKLLKIFHNNPEIQEQFFIYLEIRPFTLLYSNLSAKQ